MDYKLIAKEIINLSGGSDNFNHVTNCMTRVRINYKDLSKVNLEEIKNLTGVQGINQAESTQIIVGPGKSEKIRAELENILNISVDTDNPTEKQVFLKTLSNIFVPALPAIIASGVSMGVNNIIKGMADAKVINDGIQATGVLSAQQVALDGWNILELSTFLSIVGNATFAFLAIYIGITAARVFKTDMILGGILGAITIAGELSVLGLQSGQGGLFGVIFGVFLLAKIQKLLRKVIPDILDVVLTPTFTILITGGLYLIAIMPIAGFLSDLLIDGIMWILDVSGILGGFVLSAVFPSLIATGLHHGLAPIHMELLNTTGTTPIFTVQVMSNAGLVGAGLAILLLSKDPKVKEIAKGAIPTTFLAVGEPTMYGVVIPSGFGFITASIGAGFGGMMIRLLDVQASAIGAAGMSALPLIANGAYINYLLSYAVGLIAAFILTYGVGKAKKYH
ncbi:PTS system EIIBC component [Halolactibacillus miurensis]|uniref:PTS system EIIBC component n=1 Tax=Halolactibacillus miurensis TaxID=306541 RepID=A0A1I6Q123_9BACI|nr:PTS transporter subunit EIIC [Halolactibacillus miurensis]GEM05330.1 PTS system EIIBC component [Halolactibacillus miurensis]SFS46114.1 PTS system, sucrose-specific IIC component [Halolactibacillus miurensis]